MPTPTTGQFAGTADRDRVFPRDPDAQFIPRLEVGELHIGGIVLRPGQGTHYANGRLDIAGKGDNGCEVQQVPGPDCQGKGVITQWLMFAAQSPLGFLRHCFTWVRDGDGNDRFVEDQSASGDRVCVPWYRNIGGKTFMVPGKSARTGRHYEAGEDDGGRDIDAYFTDGSDEYTLPDGRRVEYRSLFAAIVELSEAGGIALQIRGPAGE